MSDLAFVLLSPKTINRQLAGVMLSRIMVRGSLELAAAQLIDFSAADADKLAAVVPQCGNLDLASAGAALLCLFKGENVTGKLSALVCNMESSFGENLLAVPENDAQNAAAMPVIAEIAKRDNLLVPVPGAGKERTLLIIKPENFRQPSTRPGAIIDMLMSLELDWIGCKVHGMSIDEALEFYGPVRQALRGKLGARIGAKAVELLEKEFNFSIASEQASQIAGTAGNAFADDQFEQIVEFMAGKRPAAVAPADRSKPAGAKCMVLIFDGVDAVAKIRTLLGPTNPAQATGGTVRYDFGTNIMVNAAHASDSIESYVRESAVVKVNSNDLSAVAGSII